MPRFPCCQRWGHVTLGKILSILGALFSMFGRWSRDEGSGLHCWSICGGCKEPWKDILQIISVIKSLSHQPQGPGDLILLCS